MGAAHAIARRTVDGAERADLGHLTLGNDLDAELLGEPQIVLDQGVLGSVAAADHAVAAAQAAAAGRSLTSEVWIRNLLSGRPEEDPDAGVAEAVADPDLLSVFLQQRVSGADSLVFGDPEHPLGGLVVGGKVGLPVAELGPLRIAEERRPGPVERVRVSEAAAADSVAGCEI